METLGLWQALQLSDEAAARTVINHMWQSGKPVEITLETIHGHAVKKLLLPEGESAMQFSRGAVDGGLRESVGVI